MLKRFTVWIFLFAGLVTFATASDENQNACKGDPGKWQQLFNGKDLTGWKHVGPGGDTVEDGLIRTHGGMGLLYWTGGKIGNCVIHVMFKMRDENDNSGVLKEDEYHSTGMLYSLTKPLAKAWKPGPDWNTMDITLDGSRTVVMLNGVKVTDYKEGDPVPERKFDFEPQRGPRPDFGYFGVQNHSDNDIVFFKEVAIKPLKK